MEGQRRGGGQGGKDPNRERQRDREGDEDAGGSIPTEAKEGRKTKRTTDAERRGGRGSVWGARGGGLASQHLRGGDPSQEMRAPRSPRPADGPMDKAGESPGAAGAGPVPAGTRAQRGKEGRASGEKGKEAEVPGGRGARAGSGEGRRGGGLRKNAPTSCPARARKREPGPRARDCRARPRAPRRSPPRGHQVLGPRPRPASSPRLLGEVGRRREGLGRCCQRRGLLRTPRSQRPHLGPQFSHLLKGAKRGELTLDEYPVGGDERCEAGAKASHLLSGGQTITPIVRVGKPRPGEPNRLVPGNAHHETVWRMDGV